MKPAWYGGNKIPDSYLKQFQRSDDRGTDNWRGAFEMSALGITFVALALSWLIRHINSNIDHPISDVIYIICGLIFLGALVTGIVLVGMML
jgi:hypothetical protein